MGRASTVAATRGERRGDVPFPEGGIHLGSSPGVAFKFVATNWSGLMSAKSGAGVVTAGSETVVALAFAQVWASSQSPATCSQRTTSQRLG
jgi:hypothetical protein